MRLLVKLAAAEAFQSVPWSLSRAAYTNASFSVAAQSTGPEDIAFKTDGTKLYVLGGGFGVFQYSLSTAWNLSTASYDSVSFSVKSEDAAPTSLAFKSDGTKMYVLGGANDKIYQYSLSTAWDLSTASYDSVSFSIATEETIPQGLAFKSDGTRMYVVGLSQDTVYQYSLTAWDLSTASYDSVSFSVLTEDASPTGLAFKSDGTKMYVVGLSGDPAKVYQYSLSTAWNLSTASYDSISFSVTSEDAAPTSLAFKSDGTRMYVVGDGSDTVYQYSL